MCLVQARLLGVIEAEQTQGRKTFRNDRILAAAVGSRLYAKVSDLGDFPPTFLEEVEQFFINYNQMKNRFRKYIEKYLQHAYFFSPLFSILDMFSKNDLENSRR